LLFFSATVWNFILKFYRIVYWNVLRLTAKRNVILLKNDKVIDFLSWLPTDFPAFKNVQAKNAITFSLTGYHVTADDIPNSC